MKKILILLITLTFNLVYSHSNLYSYNPIQLSARLTLGDVNDDGSIDILDVVLMVNFILGSDTPDALEFAAADLNSDGILNILDVVTLTNLILGA